MCKSIILQLKTHRQIPHPENPQILVILIQTNSFFIEPQRTQRTQRKYIKVYFLYTSFLCEQ